MQRAAVARFQRWQGISVTISASGIIGGTSASGCNFTGSATPRTDVAAVFDLCCHEAIGLPLDNRTEQFLGNALMHLT